MIFHENRLLADNSHEILYLIFFKKIRKMSLKLLSAAVMIGALRVNDESMQVSNRSVDLFAILYEIMVLIALLSNEHSGESTHMPPLLAYTNYRGR